MKFSVCTFEKYSIIFKYFSNRNYYKAFTFITFRLKSFFNCFFLLRKEDFKKILLKMFTIFSKSCKAFENLKLLQNMPLKKAQIFNIKACDAC